MTCKNGIALIDKVQDRTDNERNTAGVNNNAPLHSGRPKALHSRSFYDDFGSHQANAINGAVTAYCRSVKAVSSDTNPRMIGWGIVCMVITLRQGQMESFLNFSRYFTERAAFYCSLSAHDDL